MTENTTYISKPETVEARQMTLENIDELARWCSGKVLDTSVLELDAPQGRLCIEMTQTNYEGRERKVHVYVGDWIVLHEGSRFMLYLDREFTKMFSDPNNHASPILPYVTEFVRNAMNARTPDWTEETFESCLMDVSNAICALSSYYQVQTFSLDPKKVLPLVREAMVEAIQMMSGPRVNQADTMNRMQAIASEYARKIASTT